MFAAMRHLLRWSWRGLLGLVALLLLGVAAAAGLVWWTLPGTGRQLALPALHAPVTVLLDRHGVPTIRAADEHDAAVALGWLHARDRLFEMEVMRRGASGRLAEVLGAAAIRSDRFTRTLDLAGHARADYAALPADTRAVLDAYAAGVNARIAERGRFAAPEFLLLGAPEPWQPADSLLWAKVMGLWLSGNWRTELDRARLAPILPPDRLAELWPTDRSPGHPEQLAAAPPLDPARLARLQDALPRFPVDAPLPATASNIWAVSGAHSRSGKPLLASDPHLGFGAPILWYLARIELPGRTLEGATSPGVPFVVIGRNDHLAWGFTTTGSDTQDVFVERLAGPDSYQTPDGAQPFAVREERIAVRGAAPETLRVRETRHGPVVSDLDGGSPDGTVLAVSMANLATPDSAATGLLGLNRANSVAEARNAAALITSPPQNLVVADDAGRIALYLTGRVPIRRGGDGSVPAPGWDGSADWTGWVPFDSLPHVEDPASGAVVNANNRVAPADVPVFLGRDWYGDWRFRRIGQRLAAAPRHTAEDFGAIQLDDVSLLVPELLPLLRGAPRPDGAAGTAYDLLLDWDGHADPAKPQPLIFNAWWRAFAESALGAGGVPRGAWPPTPEFARFLARPRGARWCGPEGCPARAAAALRDAVAALQPQLGPDPAAWRWGAVHLATFEHPVLRFVPLLGRWTTLSIPTPGDGETVNRGGMTGRPPEPFRHVHGAGLRAVFDLGLPLSAPGAARLMIATGQSGNPVSPHWGDLLEAWRDGKALHPGDPREGSAGEIQLVP